MFIIDIPADGILREIIVVIVQLHQVGGNNDIMRRLRTHDGNSGRNGNILCVLNNLQRIGETDRLGLLVVGEIGIIHVNADLPGKVGAEHRVADDLF